MMYTPVCRIVRALMLCAALVCLPACAAFLDPGPPMTNIYLPVTVPAYGKASAPLPVQLLVARPIAATGAATDRIMALMNGYEVKALDSAKWMEPVPLMLQNKLIEILDGSGMFLSVSRSESGQDSRVRLTSDIARFNLRYGPDGRPPVAETACTFNLVDMQSGALLARTHVRREQPCAENSVEGFVAAFSAATAGMLAEVRDWAIASLAGYKPPSEKKPG